MTVRWHRKAFETIEDIGRSYFLYEELGQEVESATKIVPTVINLYNYDVLH
jgi:hypothetical protein